MSVHTSDFVPSEESVRASLAPPEAAREYINPVEDDTWVRNADLVRMEQLRSVNDNDVAAKRALLKEFASSSQQSSVRNTMTASSELVAAPAGAGADDAAILEGMVWQEKFLTDYKKQNAAEDSNKVLTYKQQMLENFRKKHGAAANRS